MEKPIITINGDRAETLVHNYMEAKSAIDKAIEAFEKIFPHGRNYQTDNGGLYERARAEHLAMVEKLSEFSNLLEEQAMYCAEYMRS